MHARVGFRDRGASRRDAAPLAGARPRPDTLRRLLVLTILLLPLNWLFGTSLLWLFASTLVFLWRPGPGSLVELLMLWLIGAFLLGLGVAALGGVSGDRAMASLYNAAIALILIAFCNAARRLVRRDREADNGPGERAALYAAALKLFVLNAAFVGVVFALTKVLGRTDLTIPTLLGIGGRLPGVFGEYGHADFSITDWTVSGPETRVVGFGIYATEGALLFLLLGLLGGIVLAGRQAWGRWLAAELAIAVGLVIMASRTTLGAYLLSLPLLAVYFRKVSAKLVLLTAPVVVLSALVVLVFGRDEVLAFIAARNSERLGSSGTRFLSYFMGIDLVMNTNPLTGLGIKPRDDSLLVGIPIGSHSTLSSVFTKSGFVGLTVLACVYAALLAGIVKAQARVLLGRARDLTDARRLELVQLSRCVLIVLVWWVTEDFDAPAYEAAMAGLCFGLLWGGIEDGAGSRPVPAPGRAGTVLDATSTRAHGARPDVPPRHKGVS